MARTPKDFAEQIPLHSVVKIDPVERELYGTSRMIVDTSALRRAFLQQFAPNDFSLAVVVATVEARIEAVRARNGETQ